MTYDPGAQPIDPNLPPPPYPPTSYAAPPVTPWPAIYPPGSPAGHQAPRQRSRWKVPAIVAGAVVVILVVGSVVLASLGGSSKFSLNGSIELSSTSIETTPTFNLPCDGSGGYSDITKGTEVVVTDASGKTLAIGSLFGSVAISATDCILTFHVDGVPGGKNFYGVQVSHRGTLQYSEAQMKHGISLSLGDGS